MLNASAWESAESGPVRELIQYMATGDATGVLTEEIDGLVDGYNEDWKWVNRLMTLDEDIEYRCSIAMEQGIEQGMEQGMEQGENRFGALAERLIELGRADEVALAVHDGEARDRLFAEFGL